MTCSFGISHLHAAPGIEQNLKMFIELGFLGYSDLMESIDNNFNKCLGSASYVAGTTNCVEMLFYLTLQEVREVGTSVISILQ